MTRSRVGWTLLVALGALGCGQEYLCPQEDHPSLLITARNAAFGELLMGLSGTVTSDGQVLTLGCFVKSGADQCEVHARGESADIHLVRDGFLPWDTTNVRLMWTGREGCTVPILKRVEARMEPVE